MVNRCIGYSGCGDQSVNETLGLQLNNLQDELNANSAFVSGAIQPLPGLRVGLSNDNNDVAQDIFLFLGMLMRKQCPYVAMILWG